MIVISTPLTISSSVRDIERLLRESPPFERGGCQLEDVHLEAVVAHELWHVRRRDNLAGALHMVVEAMFWFHPLVWWVGARLVDERERARLASMV